MFFSDKLLVLDISLSFLCSWLGIIFYYIYIYINLLIKKYICLTKLYLTIFNIILKHILFISFTFFYIS